MIANVTVRKIYSVVAADKYVNSSIYVFVFYDFLWFTLITSTFLGL